MTWLAFIASLINSLAWPIAIAILALGFRKQVTSILPRLTKAKAFGGELEFGQALDKLEFLSPAPIQMHSNLADTDTSRAKEDIAEKLASIDISRSRLPGRTSDPPEYRIISAWKLLYYEISAAALAVGKSVRGYLSQRELQEIGPAIGLSPDQIQQVKELRELRNRAANEPDWKLTVTDALRYEDLVLSLATSIDNRKQNKDGGVGSS